MNGCHDCIWTNRSTDHYINLIDDVPVVPMMPGYITITEWDNDGPYCILAKCECNIPEGRPYR